MKISKFCLLLFIILFNKVEAKDFDFSKTYVSKTYGFQLNFNEEEKTCNLYGLFGILISHSRYMERRDYRYSVVEDTLILYLSDDYELLTFEGCVSEDEKRRVNIGYFCMNSYGDSLGCLSPEYSVFINDSLYVKDSYVDSVEDSLYVREILYNSNLKKDKIVIECNCSHAAFLKNEYCSDGLLTIVLENCQEYIAKFIVKGRTLQAIPGSTLWLPYEISYDHKAIFKPRSKIWLKRWHRKHPISKYHLPN